MACSLVAVGSNLGDRAATLDAAIVALRETGGVELLRQSSWQMTLPVGVCAGRSEFLNGAVLVETTHSPQQLLQHLKAIENQFGRDRRERWSDRTLDLDLLLYDDAILDTPALTLPHPRMSFRRFVLEPAVEIAPELVHPTVGWTLEHLLEHLDSGTDAIAIVSRADASRDELVAELLRRYEMEPSTATIQDDGRWPARSTTWLQLPDAQPTRSEPKLTIVYGKETPHIAGRGPTLCVPVADGQDLLTDIFAAIEAVWPHLAALT